MCDRVFAGRSRLSWKVARLRICDRYDAVCGAKRERVCVRERVGGGQGLWWW